jgi:hypothetical protein
MFGCNSASGIEDRVFHFALREVKLPAVIIGNGGRNDAV